VTQSPVALSAPLAARVLVADPPWAFGDRLPGPSRGAAKNYSVMATEAIARFALPPLERNAWLFLWRVSAMQGHAITVARAWGFEPKTELVWRKLTTTGKPWFGMGHYLRAAHETCIVAVRGSVRPRVRNIRSVFEAEAGAHSEKPEAFYRIVEQLTGGPYVELFARRRRLGWYCFGDELPALEAA
jgi:N6-adenosine-specific RNA methylase IME4